MNKLYCALFSLMLCGPATAASLKDAKTVFTSGNWKVLRNTDSMTDAISCTGIYKSDYAVQLTKDRLHLSVPDGVRGITLRFGDEPARSTRLPDRMEERLSIVTLAADEFSDLLRTNRLRVRVLTLLSGLEDFDLDVRGIQAAVDNIQSGCELTASSRAGR